MTARLCQQLILYGLGVKDPSGAIAQGGVACMQELERIGNEQSLIIAVGYMLRYNPAIETAKALLEEVRPVACPLMASKAPEKFICYTEIS